LGEGLAGGVGGDEVADLHGFSLLGVGLGVGASIERTEHPF
jgi:hypothetical protein